MEFPCHDHQNAVGLVFCVLSIRSVKISFEIFNQRWKCLPPLIFIGMTIFVMNFQYFFQIYSVNNMSAMAFPIIGRTSRSSQSKKSVNEEINLPSCRCQKMWLKRLSPGIYTLISTVRNSPTSILIRWKAKNFILRRWRK